jgi:hypothetical protein
VLIGTTVTVEFSYVLKDGRTGEVLWTDRRRAQQSSGDGGGNLVVALVSAAVTKASPNYIPLARKANAQALAYPGPGILAGPYRPEHGRDWTAGDATTPPPPPAAAAVAPAPASTPAAPARAPAAISAPASPTPAPH